MSNKSRYDELMNRKSITIWICGAVFALSLFVAVTPMAHAAGHSFFEFPPKVIIMLIVGWDLIIGTCIFLVKSKRKRRLL